MNKALVALYGKGGIVGRRLAYSLAYRLERGEFYSTTLREIMRVYYGVTIGMYSHGGCFTPGFFDKHTTVGRYCSIAHSVRVMNRNHPVHYHSMHAFFFNPALGICTTDLVPYVPLTIGNDVWIGHGALVLPHVTSIGNGAVVGAGAVVNKDVPPYAIVVGNPARQVRFRFPAAVIKRLQAEQWWEQPLEQVRLRLGEFCGPLEMPVSVNTAHESVGEQPA